VRSVSAASGCRANDDEYVERKYREVQDSIQAGMDALARERALPLFG
jgi:hypothetical protein